MVQRRRRLHVSVHSAGRATLVCSDTVRSEATIGQGHDTTREVQRHCNATARLAV